MRTGIISVGTWLADLLKFINRYPAAGNLTPIIKEEKGLGGCSHNVLVDLARLESGIPLFAGGYIGTDGYGDWIMDRLQESRIDSRYMRRLNGQPTSYTDVMIDMETATRTFFHNKGANALLDIDHFEKIDVPARIFHLGYLLLLDKLEEKDPEYDIKAARILHLLQKKGYKTSVDVVSEEGERFKEIILPCLPYVNYFIVNEVESGACYGENLRNEKGEILLDKVKEAAAFLMDKGVNDLCVIHFPEGGYALDKEGNDHYEPSLLLKEKEIASTVGAGDAFCAGVLYAVHEGMSLKDTLIFANSSARFNLRHATCCGGAPTLKEIKEFIKEKYETK